MKWKTWADRLFLLGFLGFLLLALVVTLVRPKSGWSYYENRVLARPAPLTAETVLDGTFAAQVEPVLQDHAAGRNTLLKWSTWADLYLFRRPVVNQVIPTGEMLLGFNPYETPDPAVISAQAEGMAEELAQLQELVEGYGGHFCYVSVPGQYTYFAQEHPDFLNSREAYTALELPAFVEAMEERGVPLIEMGARLEELGNPPELYSTTDYHYQMGGAYQTYLAILEYIQSQTQVELPRLEGEQVVFEELPNPYLGSRARKVFGLGGIEERLTIATPAVPIPFTRTDNGSPTAETVYQLPQTDTEEVAYSLYMGGDIGETVLDTGREELPTLLIYGDSFTNPVECLMYYSFDEMRTIDLRHYQGMTLAEYIQQHQPDFVVGIRDYEALLSTDYNGNPFA